MSMREGACLLNKYNKLQSFHYSFLKKSQILSTIAYRGIAYRKTMHVFCCKCPFDIYNHHNMYTINVAF